VRDELEASSYFLIYDSFVGHNADMETFSVRDLRERSGEFVRELEQGRLALITKHGKTLSVTVPMSEHLLRLGVPLALAIELFRGGAVSVGLAAKIAGVSYAEFVDQLGRLRIPVVDYDPAELARELTVLE
jgi:predicted HTH domain antitoxin